MRLNQNHVRSTCVGPINPAEVQALAAVLTYQPVEVLLTAQGAVIPPGHTNRSRQRIQDGSVAAVALAKRNIRSLLSFSRDAADVAEALRVALIASPADAHAAMEDAGLEMNLRYSLFTTPNTVISLQDRCLTIAGCRPPTVRIARRNLRTEAAKWFCADAQARLAGLDVDELHLSPEAIWPTWMQLEPGAIMSPDTAHQHLKKGGWRAVRKPDFLKAHCVACGRCFIHCPENAVIHATYQRHAKETTGILGIDSERCTACGLCAAVCPTNGDGYKAIVMIEADADSSPELHCVG